MLAPLIPVMYLDTAVDSLLKGLGEQVYTMWVNIADASLSVILVALLLPKMGINGYIITVYFTEIINATLSITRLLSKCEIRPRIFLWIGRPLLCIIGATRVTHYFTKTLSCNVWLHIVIASIIYVVFMILCGGIKLKVIINRIKYISKEKS